MTKSITLAIAIAAFVVGTIVSGTVAYAQNNGQGDGPIIGALNGIAQAISDINPNVNVDPTPVNVQVIAEQGEQGPQGEGCSIEGTIVTCGETSSDVQGPPGEQGPAGVLPNIYERTSFGDISPNNQGSLVANCDEGDVPVSGGWIAVDNFDSVIPDVSHRSLDDEEHGWLVHFSNPTSESISVATYVYCFDVTS